MTPFARQALQVVRAIPPGQVLSYGGVVAVMGRARGARGVGSALQALPEDSDVPWWRVVNRHGAISLRPTGHGAAVQRALLEAEGVRFGADGRIDLERYAWDGAGYEPG